MIYLTLILIILIVVMFFERKILKQEKDYWKTMYFKEKKVIDDIINVKTNLK